MALEAARTLSFGISCRGPIAGIGKLGSPSDWDLITLVREALGGGDVERRVVEGLNGAAKLQFILQVYVMWLM